MNRKEALEWCVNNIVEWSDVDGNDSPQGWFWEMSSKETGEWTLRDFEKVHPAITRLGWDKAMNTTAPGALGVLSKSEAITWCVTHVEEWPMVEGDDTPRGWDWGWNGSDIMSIVLVNITGEVITQLDWTCEKSPTGKQSRYTDTNGEDWIDEFARTATVEEFRGAMKFTIGKYNRRMGKKDDISKEIEKIRDYAQRWKEYENNA